MVSNSLSLSLKRNFKEHFRGNHLIYHTVKLASNSSVKISRVLAEIWKGPLQLHVIVIEASFVLFGIWYYFSVSSISSLPGLLDFVF